MIVASCPRCAESCRIPDTPPPDDAYAECPWCQETYPVAELYHQLPPEVRIVSADGRTVDWSSQPAALLATVGEDASEGFDSVVVVPDDPMQTRSGLESKTVAEETVLDTWQSGSVSADESLSDASDFELDEPDSGLDVEPPAGRVAPMKVTPPPVPKKKRKPTTIRTMLGIVLGALAAGPLAVGILWLFSLLGVPVNLGFWPLNGNTSINKPSRIANDPGSPSARPTDHSEQRTGDESSLTDGAWDPDDPPSSSRGDSAFDDQPDDPPVDSSGQTGSSGDPTAGFGDMNDEDDPFAGPSTPADPSPDVSAATDDTDSEFDLGFGMDTEIDDDAGASEASLETNEVPRQVSGSDAPDADAFENFGLGFPSPQDTADAGNADSIDPLLEGAPQPIPSATPEESTDLTDASETADPFALPAADSLSTRTEPGDASMDSVSDVFGPVDRADSTGPDFDTAPPPAELQQPSDDSIVEVPVVIPPPVESPAVREVIDQAMDTLSELAAEASPERSQLAITYKLVADVGSIAEADSESMQELLSAVAESPAFSTWSGAVASWLKHPNRKIDGVLLIGTAVQPRRVRLSDGTSIPLTEDSVAVTPPERIVGLGRILDNELGQSIRLVAAMTLP